MMNKEKIERIIETIKKYIVEKVGGEESVWEWMVCSRYDWNGGCINLRVHTWPEVQTLEVATFMKSRWGVGWRRDGSLGWKFSYSEKEINNLLSNKEFIEAIDSFVLSYYNKKKVA